MPRPLWLALAEQEGGAAEGASAHYENRPSQPGKETDALGCREEHQAEQVEGNHEQDAEQDRNQHDRGCNPLHVRNITEPDGTRLVARCRAVGRHGW
jgi:hypothetical protein